MPSNKVQKSLFFSFETVKKAHKLTRLNASASVRLAEGAAALSRAVMEGKATANHALTWGSESPAAEHILSSRVSLPYASRVR